MGQAQCHTHGNEYRSVWWVEPMGLVGGANLVERVVEAEVAANSAAERVVEQGVVANSVDSARVAVVD